MRILVVADVHANWPALAAIKERYDACLCIGDLVEYGPDPRKVIAWVRENAAHCVRGNHDHGTAQNVDILGVGGFRYLTMATRGPTIRMLPTADRKYLARLPTSDMFTLGGKRFLLVHATPRDPLDEYVAPDPAQWASRIAGLDVDYVCVGHTHQPFVLEVGKAKVVNPGSVGLPRDGNPCARYAVIDGDTVELKEAPYDVNAAITALAAAPFDPRAKQMLADVYRTGRFVHGTNGTNGHHNGVPKLP
jgi:putative phosphoesterase